MFHHHPCFSLHRNKFLIYIFLLCVRPILPSILRILCVYPTFSFYVCVLSCYPSFAFFVCILHFPFMCASYLAIHPAHSWVPPTFAFYVSVLFWHTKYVMCASNLTILQMCILSLRGVLTKKHSLKILIFIPYIFSTWRCKPLTF